MTHIYYIEQLKNLVDPDNIASGQSFTILEGIGGVQGLEKQLNTSRKQGILDNDLQGRAKKYGRYTGADTGSFSIKNQFFQELKDELLRFLLFLSLIWIITGIFSGFFKYGITQNLLYGGIQGISLFFLLLVGTLVKALVAKLKFQRFNNFNSIMRNDSYTLKRNGEIKIYKRNEIRIGDLFLMKQGDFIKEDCLLVEGKVIIDESELMEQCQNKQKQKQKIAWNDQQLTQMPKINSFINSGSEVIKGQGWAIILTIDTNTVYSNVLSKKIQQQDDYSITPLQYQIVKFAQKIGQTGLVLAFFIFIGVLFRYFISCFASQSVFGIIFSIISFSTLDKIIEAAILGVSFAYFFIPDTLPSVTTNYISYLLLLLHEDKLQIRYLQVIEDIQLVNYIILDEIIIEQNDKQQIQMLRDFGYKFMKITQNQQPADKNFDYQSVRKNINKETIIQLKNENYNVLYTGSDSTLIKQAHVGVALSNSNRQFAKRKSGVYLHDSKLSTLLKFLRWGTLFNLNVKRFIQFFINNNLTLLIVLLTDSYFFYYQYFTTSEMIWLKLFLDVFAIAVYAYDKPTRYQYSKPIKNETLISKEMWINIFYQVVIQSLILIIFMSIDFNFLKGQNCENLETNTEHKARVFDLFFFIQLANLINCRDIFRDYKNIYQSLNSGRTIFIIMFMVIAQISFTFLHLGQKNLIPFYCILIVENQNN